MRAGKSFVLADVYVAEQYAGVRDKPMAREIAERPTPSEFWAAITVDVATNLDEMAASRNRPRKRIDLEGATEDTTTAYEKKRAPGAGSGEAGEASVDEAFNKKWLPDETVCRLTDEQVPAMCLLTEYAPVGHSWRYTAEFIDGMGTVLRGECAARNRANGNHMRSGCAGKELPSWCAGVREWGARRGRHWKEVL